MMQLTVRALFLTTFLVAVITFGARRAPSVEPTVNLAELKTQTFAAPIDPTAIDKFVNKLSRAEAIDVAEEALELALTRDEIPSATVERLAACYYNLLLQTAVRADYASTFDAYADRVLNDARRFDVCANVAIQACRNLGAYDSERAKKLYLDLVGDLASSDQPSRRAAAQRVLNGARFKVDSASDCDFDPNEFQYNGETNADAARRLATLTALYNLCVNARALQSRSFAFNFSREFSTTADYYALLASYEQALRESPYAPSDLRFKIDDSATLARVARICNETKPDVILEALDQFRKETRENSYRSHTFACYLNAMTALGVIASADGTDESLERLVEQYVSIIESDPDLTSNVAIEIARDLKRLDDRWRARFIERLKASCDTKTNDVAVRVEGAFRALAGSGFQAALEGVCVDGSQITLDDYRGKRTLLCINTHAVTRDERIPLIEKYIAAGLEVVLYEEGRFHDFASAAPAQRFKEISRARSQANYELGGRKYVELTDYYGLDRLAQPRVILIDANGMVVTSGSSPDNILDDLQKLFPEVE